MNQARRIQLLAAATLLFSSSAFAFDFFNRETETTVTSGDGGPDIQQAQAEAYNGPKARVAVSRFTNKAGQGWWSGAIGDGMADQLTTALFNTNRYIVLERQTLGDVIAEQDLGASGRVSQQTAAPIGQIEGAELLITGAVTEFEGNAGGTRAGGGGVLGSVVGAIAGSVRKSHMAIDVRIIDARTSRILAATSVEGSSSDVDLGGAVGTYFGGGALGGALSSWENTPKEKALRACINKAVEFVVSKTPRSYYHYGSGSRSASSSSPKAPNFAVGSGVRVSSASLNVRSGPGTGNPVVFKASRNDPMIVEEQQGNWIRVRAAGGTGWTAGWLVQGDSGVTPASLTAAPAAAAAPAVQSSGGGTVADRLKKLKKLHEQGLITDKEYAAKRDEILESL